MRRILQVSFFIACLTMLGADHGAKVVCAGFLPENNLNIPVNFVSDGGITQDQWTALFDKYEKIYTPIIASRGATLQLNRLWDDGTVNANASESGTVWTINMFGGLARYPLMNFDGMALVVCHETGHHLGGAPKWANSGPEWATNEGGADYFATLKCAKLMFAADDNVKIVSSMKIEPLVQKNCEARYTVAGEVAMCERISSAGIVLGKLLADLGQSTVDVNTPDKSVVTDTITDGYPGDQCRLDTYVAASLCTADMATFQGDDYHTGSCTAPKFTVGLRPTCWFKPDAGDSAKILARTSN